MWEKERGVIVVLKLTISTISVVNNLNNTLTSHLWVPVTPGHSLHRAPTKLLQQDSLNILTQSNGLFTRFCLNYTILHPDTPEIQLHPFSSLTRIICQVFKQILLLH